MILLEATVTISQTAIITILLSTLSFVGVLVTLLHKDMTGKIMEARSEVKEIHTDLKPLTIQVAQHDIQIKDVKRSHADLCLKVDEHSNRIHTIENKMAKYEE